MRFVRSVLIGALVTLGLLCVLTWLWDRVVVWPVGHETMKEVRSPDGAATAYVVRSNPGAMSSFIYSVRVSPAGVGPEGARVLIQGARMEGLDFTWQGPRELRVRVPCGRFSEATNFLGDASRNLWVDVFFDFQEPNCHGPARPA